MQYTTIYLKNATTCSILWYTPCPVATKHINNMISLLDHQSMLRAPTPTLTFQVLREGGNKLLRVHIFPEEGQVQRALNSGPRP